VAAVIYFLEGILYIAVALFFLTTFMGLAAIPELVILRTTLGNIGVALAILPLAIGILLLVVGWGLVSLLNWARVLAFVLSALLLLSSVGGGVWTALSLAAFFPIVGIPALLLLIVHAWMIYYFLQPEVKDAFAGVAHAPPAYTPPPYVPPAEPVTPLGVPVQPQVVYSPTVPQPTAPPPPAQPFLTAAPGPARTEILRKPPAQMAWLVAKSGSQAGKEFRLREETRVGRDPAQNDIIVDDSTVSKQHAKIRLENGQWILFDLASTNGTFVNDQQIYRQPLTDGDVVRLGQATFAFMELKEKEKKEA